MLNGVAFTGTTEWIVGDPEVGPNSVVETVIGPRSGEPCDPVPRGACGYYPRSSLSYSPWGPIQNQTMSSPSSCPTAR